MRYVDDITCVAETRSELLAIKAQITDKLADEGLTIHPKKHVWLQSRPGPRTWAMSSGQPDQYSMKMRDGSVTPHFQQ